jgi:hypothetical protein
MVNMTNKIIDVSELSFSTEEELLSLKKIYNFFYSCVIYTHSTTDLNIHLFDEQICYDESSTFSHLDSYIHSKNKVFDCIFFMDIDSLFNGTNQVQMIDIIGFIKNISAKYNCHIFYRSQLYKNSIRRQINPIVIENHDKVNDTFFIDRPVINKEDFIVPVKFIEEEIIVEKPEIIQKEEPVIVEEPEADVKIIIPETVSTEKDLDDFKDVTFYMQQNESVLKSMSGFFKKIFINFTDKF